MKKKKTISAAAIIMLSGLMANAQNMIIAENTAVVKNTSGISAIKEYKTPIGIFTLHTATPSSQQEAEKMEYTLQTFKIPGGGTATLLRSNNQQEEEQNNVVVENNVSVYPNPFTASATIVVNYAQLTTNSINGSTESITNTPLKLVIYDISGRIMQESEITNLKGVINRGNLQAGMYFYMVTREASSGQARENNIIGKGKFIIQ